MKSSVNLQRNFKIVSNMRKNQTKFWLFACFFIVFRAQGQVFMQPFDHAAALSLGGAVIAYPGIGIGAGNDAAPGLASKAGALASSALPYGISGWTTAQVQGWFKAGSNNGFALDLQHSGVEAYSEQQFRLIYGRKLSNKLLLGGGLSLLRVNAREYGTLAQPTFSISVLSNPLPHLWVGAKVHNPVQQKAAGQLLPTILRIGAAWQPSSLFVLLAEVEKDLERTTQIKFGAEYKPISALTIRTGMRSGSVGRVAFGAGMQLYKNLFVDVGSEWHPALGFTPSAMVRFGK
jgi:hypothetical protein